MEKMIVKLAGALAVGLTALNGAAVPAGAGAVVITAGEGYSGSLLLISGGLLFLVRRKTRRK